MKITFLSDTHSLHNEVTIEPCDIFCYSGDATNIGELADWVSFFEWLRKVPAKHIVWIGGNHDRTLDRALMEHRSNDAVIRMLNTQKYNDVRRLIQDLPKHIHYLENKAITIEGINFYGSPYSPAFGHNWAFNKVRGDASAQLWAKIPKNTNILLTHTPPQGILDYVDKRKKRYPDEPQNVGCKELLDRIKHSLPNLKVHAFGHIHDNTGMQYLHVSNTRRVLFINACLLDNRYNFLTKQPITINF